jgi:hypothetical protein
MVAISGTIENKENKRVIIIGGGASVKEGIDKGLWSYIKGEQIWSLNFAWLAMPYLPSRELWVDIKFFRDNIERLEELSKKGVVLIAKTHRDYLTIPQIKQYNTSRESNNYFGKEALAKNIIFYGRQGLVGTFALSLAIGEGFKNIFLVGFDYGTPDINEKFTHFYQDKIKELSINSSGVGRPLIYRNPNNTVKRDVEDYKIYLREKDVNIYNVSLLSNIPYFQKISYEEFFKILKKDEQT